MDTMGGTGTGMMAASKLATAHAYGVLRVQDYRRARTFYHDVLGLQVVDDEERPGNGIVTAGGGTMFELYERPGFAAPENTALGFVVQDFDGTMAELRGRGVVFEDYDIPELHLKTVGGVMQTGEEKVAWFRDTEGNILALVHSPKWVEARATPAGSSYEPITGRGI